METLEQRSERPVDVCPECESTNVYKDGENFEGEYFECLDCGADWKRLWDGTIY